MISSQCILPEIRAIQDSDFDFMMQNERASCDRDGIIWDHSERETIIRSFLSRDKKFGFIAELGGEKIGIILARNRLTNDTDVAEYHRPVVRKYFGETTAFIDLWDLWVHPDFRRRGIAAQLKQRVEDEALILGTEWIFTFQDPDNAPAIGMNRKLGYQEIGINSFWDNRPFLCFLKRIPS